MAYRAYRYLNTTENYYPGPSYEESEEEAPEGSLVAKKKKKKNKTKKKIYK